MSASRRPPLLDAHVHYWDQDEPGLSWPWLAPGFEHPSLPGVEQLATPRYAAREHAAEMAGQGVCGAVHVQAAASDPVRETEWLESMADAAGWPDAIVAACELGADGAPDLLRQHARGRRVRGVRDMAATAGLDLDRAAPALDVAAELGLSVEVRLPVERFPVLGEMARRWPAVTFVLGHAGLPMEGVDADGEARWASALADLAAHENWVCKVAGLAARAGVGWSAERVGTWIGHCLDAFGPRRSMFGTNWPLDRLFGPVDRLLEAYGTATQHLDEGERAAVFHGTAARVYSVDLAGRLDPPSGPGSP